MKMFRKEALDALREVKAIAVHGGLHHRDEYLAVSFALVLLRELGKDIDRDLLIIECVLPKDAAKGTVLVLDVGSRFEPDNLLFDHHGFDREAPAECALTLFLGWAMKPEWYALAKSVWPWLGFLALLDAKGPVSAANSIGTCVIGLTQTFSPIDEFEISNFSKYCDHKSSDKLPYAREPLVKCADYHLRNLGEVKEHLDLIRERGEVKDGVLYFMEDMVPNTTAVSFYRDQSPAPYFQVSVVKDDRGSGWTLYRFQDDPRWDFSVLEGHQHVVFAHKVGFIAKTVGGLTRQQVDDLLRLARKSS